MKNILFILLFLSLNAFSQGLNITPAEFEKTMSRKDLVVMDVRTGPEISMLGTITKDPLIKNAYAFDFKEYVSKLDKSKTYVIYCHSGVRSLKVTKLMKEKGFAVFNLEGGITKWKDQGRKVFKK